MFRLLPITKYVIHHSAGGTWGDIKAYHKSKGWGNDSAYHWFLDKQGVWYKGRDESQNSAGTLSWIANNNGIHICFDGNFEVEEPTKEQINALLHKITARKLKVVGHRDCSASVCPGKNLYSKINFFNMNLLEETIALLKSLWEKQGNADKIKIGDLAKKIREAQKVLGLPVSD